MSIYQKYTNGVGTSSIRVVTLKGNPWFVGTDICTVLRIANGSNAYVRLDPSEKSTIRRAEVGMRAGMDAVLISESGLYKLIMRSDKPQAKAFQDWVTKEVLPSIRKTGSFITGQPSLVENPQMSALEVMMAQAELLPMLIAEMKEQQLRTLFYDQTN